MNAREQVERLLNGGKTFREWEFMLHDEGYGETHRITQKKWKKELNNIPERILDILVLVVIRYYPVSVTIDDDPDDVPHLLLHTMHDGHKNTYLMGTSEYFGLSEDNTRIPVELTELRDIGIKQAMFGVDDEEPFLVILTKDNRLFSMGANSSHQLGRSSDEMETSLGEIMGIQDEICALDVGEKHCLALSSNGNAYVWGDNSYGQCTGLSEFVAYPICLDKLGGADDCYSAISCGSRHTALLTTKGKLFLAGWNSEDGLGIGDVKKEIVPKLSPVRNPGNLVVKKVNCGGWKTCVLCEDGFAFSWESNGLGLDETNMIRKGRQPAKEGDNDDYDGELEDGLQCEDIIVVNCKNEITVARSKERVNFHIWISDEEGTGEILPDENTIFLQDGLACDSLPATRGVVVVDRIPSLPILNPELYQELRPLSCRFLAKVKLVALVRIEDDYEILLHTYGRQTFTVDESNIDDPMEILELRGFDLLQARYNQITEDDGNEMFLIVLREDGSLVGRGSNKRCQLGQRRYAKRDYMSRVERIHDKVVDFDTGSHHVLALTIKGEVWAWGHSSSGECGIVCDKARPRKIYPVLGEDHGVCRSVHCGRKHSVLLTSNGQMLTFGGYTSYRRSNSYAMAPMHVMNSTSLIVTQVTCYCDWTVALTSTGTLFFWEHRNDARLQTKNMFSTNVPNDTFGEKVSKDENITCVVCRRGTPFQIAAILEDGRIIRWTMGDEHQTESPQIWQQSQNAADIICDAANVSSNGAYMLGPLCNNWRFEDFGGAQLGHVINAKFDKECENERPYSFFLKLTINRDDDNDGQAPCAYEKILDCVAKGPKNLFPKHEDGLAMTTCTYRCLVDGIVSRMVEDGEPCRADCALFQAIEYGNEDVAIAILTSKESLKSELDVESILEKVVKYKRLRVLDTMIQELDLRKNYTRYNGIVAIQQAARKDDLETFVHLWDECHEEVEKDQAHLKSIIEISVDNGNWAIIRHMLKSSERVPKVYKSLWKDINIIHLAVAANELIVVQRLLGTNKKLIECTDENGYTPLHTATERGHICIANSLLESGCKTDVSDINGNTPLLVAVQCQRLDAVKLLTSWDANLQETELSPDTRPLNMAARLGHKDIVEFYAIRLKDHHQNRLLLNGALLIATEAGHSNVVEALLQLGANKNAMNDNGDAAVHIASKFGHLEIMNLLLKEGADIYNENTKNATAMTTALKDKHTDIAKSIIDIKGAHYLPSRKEFLDITKEIPEYAAKIMDNCISVKQGANRACVVLRYDFCLLRASDSVRYVKEVDDDTQTETSESYIHIDEGCTPEEINGGSVQIRHTSDIALTIGPAEESALYIMLHSNAAWQLLRHPLASMFRKQKWEAIRIFVYLFLAFYACFTVLITLSIIGSMPVSTDMSSVDFNSTTDCNLLYKYGYIHNIHVALYALRSITLVFIVVGIISEVLQILFSLNELIEYIKNWTNVVDWTVYITACLIVGTFDECLVLRDWQWWLGIMCVALAWLNLSIFLTRLSRLGYHILLVKEMTKTLTVCLLGCLPVLLGSASIFCLLFPGQAVFDNPLESFVKSMAMMIGELDYANIFHGENDHVKFPGLSQILFCAFLVVVTTVIMNLLTGLAVGKMDAINTLAEKARLESEIPLLLESERIFMRIPFLRNCIFTKSFIDIQVETSKLPSHLRKFIRRVQYSHQRVFGKEAVELACLLSEDKDYNARALESSSHTDITNLLSRLQDEVDGIKCGDHNSQRHADITKYHGMSSSQPVGINNEPTILPVGLSKGDFERQEKRLAVMRKTLKKLDNRLSIMEDATNKQQSLLESILNKIENVHPINPAEPSS